MLKALWTADHRPEWHDWFHEHFEVTRAGANAGAGLKDMIKDSAKVLELMQGKDVCIFGMEKITREMLYQCPDLKLIMSVRDGPEENIDIAACTELGIPVIFSAGRCMVSVAEFNMLQMLELSRHITHWSEKLRTDSWRTRPMGDPYEKEHHELCGKTLSIIGFGRNGKYLSKLARAFGMDVVAYDPFVTQEQADEYGVTMMSLDDAIAAGDFVTLQARVTPETEGMFGAREVALMKPTAFLINCGRAQLTDQDAVIDAVRNDVIKGAAIDVYMKEPWGDEIPEFADIPRGKLLLTPHCAGNARERELHMYENITESYLDFLKGVKSRINNPKVFDSPNFAQRGGLLFGSEK